jgi:hypothetical protein
MHKNFDESPNTKTIELLLSKVEDGSYVIPYFQRGFEWGPSMVCDLVQSVVQGYYAGLILLWELKEKEAENEEWDPVWGAELRNTPSEAILDGQQRLSSLYYAFYNPHKIFPNRKTYYTFYINLLDILNEDDDNIIDYTFSRYYHPWEEVRNNRKEWIETGKVPLQILSAQDPDNPNEKYINSQEFLEWSGNFITENEKELVGNVSQFKPRNIFANMLSYEFITFSLSKERNLHDICNIFARVNKKGMNLSTFDLLNAFLFPKGIKLRKGLWENLDNEKLKKVDSNMNEYILKIISLKKQNYCSSKYLYNLVPEEEITRKNEVGKKYKEVLIKNSDDFRTQWQTACKFAEEAREIIMNIGNNDFGAIKQNFIPNTTLLPVLAAILWSYPGDKNNINFRKVLNKWYWAAVITEDYSGSSDSVMSKDYRDWLKWMNKNEQVERVSQIKKEYIEEIDFKNVNRSSARYNAVICLLALDNAGDFFQGRIVGTGDYSNKKINDHHIFPKKVKDLESGKTTTFDAYKDSILNRTLLLDETNQKIANQKPSNYLEEMIQIHDSEENIKELLEKHYINEKAYKYLKNNDFDNFILEREKEIKNRISNRFEYFPS